MSTQNPTANVPQQRSEDPLGDRGYGDKTWTPSPGEQGISNREGDVEPDPESDPTSFGHDGKDVVSMVDEEPSDDEFEDDEEDDNEDDEEDEDEVSDADGGEP